MQMPMGSYHVKRLGTLNAFLSNWADKHSQIARIHVFYKTGICICGLLLAPPLIQEAGA